MGTTSSTTFSAAVAATDHVVNVASATGIAAPTVNASLGTILVAGDGPAPMELMKVTAVSGTAITVQRGYNSPVYAHPSGARVWIAGAAGQLADVEPSGTIADTSNIYLPRIVPRKASVWNVANSRWVEVDLDPPTSVLTLGTAGTGVTVTEYGDDNRHLTKLTFSGITVDAVAASASEAIGVLIYTFPAGNVIVRGCAISIGLNGTAALIDANTPDTGIGTVIATGAVATLDGTGTFENIITGQTVANCTGTAKAACVGTILAIPTASAHTVHLNVAAAWSGADAGLLATGTVWLEWSLLG